MDSLTKILDQFPDEGYEKVAGFDAAIIGISSRGNLVYSIDKMIEILMSRNNWSKKDAVDYLYYTTFEDYYEKTPIFINLIK